MKVLGKIHVTVWLLGLAGAALFTILLIRQGLPQVGAAFAAAGWAIAAVVAFHLAVPVFLDALAWWILFPKSERPALGTIERLLFSVPGGRNWSNFPPRPQRMMLALATGLVGAGQTSFNACWNFWKSARSCGTPRADD